MLNSYAVLLALCLGQSDVTTSVRTGFASSDNFVVYAPDQELADAALQKSEQLRQQLAKAWLGRELPRGAGPCMIHIKLSRTEHSAFTWPKDDPAKHYHSVTMVVTRERAVGSTLAHELTHVVLATEFADKLPRWVDEGAATYQDAEDLLLKRRETLLSYIATGNWPRLEPIVNQKGLSSDERTFYTVAQSLTEFLLEKSDVETLFRFAKDGKEKGWESAVPQHYEFRSLRELERGWQKWVETQLVSKARRSVSLSSHNLDRRDSLTVARKLAAETRAFPSSHSE